MKKYLYLICLLVLSAPLTAQDLGLHTMSNVWQSNKTNPAMTSDAKFVFSFPGITASIGNSAFAYNDLITTNADGKKVLNGDNFVNLLDDQNSVWLNADLETFNINFGGEQWRVFLSHSVRSSFAANYPKTLAQLVFQGNAQFLGEEVNIGPSVSSMAYGETGIGAAIKFNKMTVGTRIKLLSGIGNISTQQSDATLFTDDKSIYELTIGSDYLLNSAGVVNVIGLTDSDVATEFEVETPGFSLLGPNKGFAIDLGLTLDLSEKLTLSASVLDLGKITWKENAKNFTSNGTYTFKGINLLDVIDNDSLAFENTVDTLADIFNFVETQESYSTALGMNSFISAAYQVSKMVRVGAMVNLRSFNGKINPTYAVNANLDLGKIFSVGTVISHNSYTTANVGLNGVLKLGPVQLFAATDNLLSTFKVLDSRTAHFRFGLNLSFGSHAKEDHNEGVNPTPEDRLSTIR